MNTIRSVSGHDLTPLSDAEKQQRAEHLTDEERRILLNQGTEPPFCGGLLLLHCEEVCSPSGEFSIQCLQPHAALAEGKASGKD